MSGKPNFFGDLVRSKGLGGRFSQQRTFSSSSSLSSTSSGDNSPLSDQSPSSPGSDSNAMECQQCTRQGAPLFCFSCGFWLANGRIRQPCSQHPKVIFYTDFSTCPKCKQTGQLRELD